MEIELHYVDMVVFTHLLEVKLFRVEKYTAFGRVLVHLVKELVGVGGGHFEGLILRQPHVGVL